MCTCTLTRPDPAYAPPLYCNLTARGGLPAKHMFLEFLAPAPFSVIKIFSVLNVDLKQRYCS